jgi:signal transduction histidine kinase/ActR/RegA family two-component response regulator
VSISSTVRLRTRLVSLGLLATAPALVVIVYTQSLERQRARERTESGIHQVTQLSASREATVFDGVERLLLTLAKLPEIQSSDPTKCKALLPSVLADHPDYINIWVIKHGKPFCAAIEIDRKLLATNPLRRWNQQAIATRQTAVGDFQISPTNGKPDVALVHPIINSAGDVEGLVAASISLDPLNEIAAQAQLPDGTTLALIDRQRRILARYPSSPTWIGEVMPSPAASSLFATAPVRGALDTGLQIAMEVENGTAMAQANSLLRQHGVLLVVLLIATVVVSLAGGERFVRRPIAELTGVTERLAAGDLSARAMVHGSAPGVDALASAVNTMATEMETRAHAESRAQAELRASEERLRHAQKLETVGQLAAGVAHNFNNLLTVIAGFTELLMARHPDAADRSDLEEIRKAAQRGALLTRQLLAFSRRQDAAPAKLDLNHTVTELRDMLARVVREDITLDISPALTPAWVLIDPHEVEQVVLNLVLNARDAMPAGGSIRIDMAHVMLHVGMAAAQPPPSTDWYVRISVTDTGTGIDPDVVQRLFEPFFTTKDAGKGTGMGLASVDGIVRHNRGAITVDSTLGKGSTFSVYFPAVPADFVVPSRDRQPDATLPAATSTILLVEDEDPLRAVVARMLAQAGYRVLDARTPTEACELFEQHQSDIALLLTDVIMPEMNGPALAQRLVARRPELRVLFVSGYTEELPVLDAPGTKTKFLAKPFTSATLVAAVLELLEPRPLAPAL